MSTTGKKGHRHIGTFEPSEVSAVCPTVLAVRTRALSPE